jgi:hypothetical protein
LYAYTGYPGPRILSILSAPQTLLESEEFRKTLVKLCNKLGIPPILHAGPDWVAMWATIGVLLAYKHGGLNRRGRKKLAAPGARIDLDVIRIAETVAVKHGLKFDDVLKLSIKEAQRRGHLVSADRTTHRKRIVRAKQRLDADRRATILGVLQNLPVEKEPK